MDPGDQLIDHYVSERPMSQELYQRAESVLVGGMGHDLRNFDPRRSRTKGYHAAARHPRQ
jgi:glutamate-1-semialdehyde aminotransferase